MCVYSCKRGEEHTITDIVAGPLQNNVLASRGQVDTVQAWTVWAKATFLASFTDCVPSAQ